MDFSGWDWGFPRLLTNAGMSKGSSRAGLVICGVFGKGCVGIGGSLVEEISPEEERSIFCGSLEFMVKVVEAWFRLGLNIVDMGCWSGVVGEGGV